MGRRAGHAPTPPDACNDHGLRMSTGDTASARKVSELPATCLGPCPRAAPTTDRTFLRAEATRRGVWSWEGRAGAEGRSASPPLSSWPLGVDPGDGALVLSPFPQCTPGSSPRRGPLCPAPTTLGARLGRTLLAPCGTYPSPWSLLSRPACELAEGRAEQSSTEPGRLGAGGLQGPREAGLRVMQRPQGACPLPTGKTQEVTSRG